MRTFTPTTREVAITTVMIVQMGPVTVGEGGANHVVGLASVSTGITSKIMAEELSEATSSGQRDLTT